MSRLWSKGIISVFADSKAQFDSDTNRLTKLGQHLKVNDIILRDIDENGAPSRKQCSWKVVRLIYSQPLGLDSLRIEQEYGVYLRQENAVLPFKLVHVCLSSKTYHFQSLSDGVGNLEVDSRNLPSIYRRDTETHADVYAVAVECTFFGKDGCRLQQELLMKSISDEKFTLDVGNCHVIEAIGKCCFAPPSCPCILLCQPRDGDSFPPPGKPRNSKVHFRVTTPEPYGVACMQVRAISCVF